MSWTHRMYRNIFNFGLGTLLAAAAGCGSNQSDENSVGRGNMGGSGGAAASGGVGGSTAGVGGGGIGGQTPVAGNGGIGGNGFGGNGGAGTGGNAGIGGNGGMNEDAGVPMGGSGDAGMDMPDPPEEEHCLDGITNYAEDGPFSFESTSSGNVEMWIPDVPDGCKVPIAHLANGTGASCSSYNAVLEHLASHGFLTTCYDDPNTGAGTQCVEAVQTALDEYPDLADMKLGSTGHSQGGSGAIMCVYHGEEEWGDSMTIAGHAMEPAHGYQEASDGYPTNYEQIESPIFMFNGSNDGLVSASWVREGFDALPDSTEAYWYEAEGAAHIPVPTSWTQESTVSWFRWKLLRDSAACEYFKNLPDTGEWSAQESQNETDC